MNDWIAAALAFIAGGCLLRALEKDDGGDDIGVPGRYIVSAALVILAALLLSACGSNPVIQPVRYQTVEVLVVKPCLAGRQLPERAQVLTAPACTKSAAECVRDARADIDDLKREADASRRLLEGCSK
jgi:hypothetical protein